MAENTTPHEDLEMVSLTAAMAQINAMRAKITALAHTLDIETLRQYHESAAPPSFHDAAWSLWECGMCRVRYAERAQKALAVVTP